MSSRRRERYTVIAALSFIIVRLSIFAADPQIDVSRIIDKAAAESILGTKLRDAASRNLQGSDGYYSKCNYYSVPPGKTLLLRIYRADAGYDPENELEAMTMPPRIPAKKTRVAVIKAPLPADLAWNG